MHPKSRNDVDKLGTAMSRLLEEDPSLRMHREASTGEVILSGLGDSHLDVATQRLLRKFGVNVTLDVPKVAYRETIMARRRPKGGTCGRRVGTGSTAWSTWSWSRCRGARAFSSSTRWSAAWCRKQYIPAVEKGIREIMDTA